MRMQNYIFSVIGRKKCILKMITSKRIMFIISLNVWSRATAFAQKDGVDLTLLT